MRIDQKRGSPPELGGFAVDVGALRFGELKTNAGRLSPYFFNAGGFDDGAKLGRLAEDALRETLKANPTLEVRRRVGRLLSEPVSDEVSLAVGETLRAHRGIRLLEMIGTPEARRALERLADGAGPSPQTQAARGSVERLKRVDGAR